MDELDHLGWVVHQSYEIGPFLLGVRTNSTEFATWLEDALGSYRTSEATDPYYSVLVAEEGDRKPGKRFDILYRESMALVRAFDLRTIARALLADIEALLAYTRDDAIYVDAGLVGRDGVHGLVMPSLTIPYIASLGRRVERTLSLPLERHVAIDPESGLAVPPPPSLAVEPRELERLPHSDGSDGGGANRLAVERPSKVDVVCAIGLAEEPLRPLPPGLAVFRLAEQAINLPAVGPDALVGLARLVEGARCYEVRSANVKGTFETLVAALGTDVGNLPRETSPDRRRDTAAAGRSSRT